MKRARALTWLRCQLVQMGLRSPWWIQASILMGLQALESCCNKMSRLWSGRDMPEGSTRRRIVGGNRPARSIWRIRSCASSSGAYGTVAHDLRSRCRPIRGSSIRAGDEGVREFRFAYAERVERGSIGDLVKGKRAQ